MLWACAAYALPAPLHALAVQELARTFADASPKRLLALLRCAGGERGTDVREQPAEHPHRAARCGPEKHG